MGTSLSHAKTIRYQVVNMDDPQTSRQIAFLTDWLRECPSDEYVFCATKEDEGGWVQEAFRVKELRNSIEHRTVSLIKPNSFISANTFTNDKTRNYASVASLTSFFLDIDYEKTSLYGSKTGETVARLVLQHIEKEQIPMPSYIVSSGHGLHVWWFMSPLPATRIRQWKEIQDELILSLKEFGADDVVKDATRMLRVPFTKNTKGTETVGTSILWHKKSKKLTKYDSMYRWMRKSIRKRWLYAVRKALGGTAYSELPLYQINYLVQEGKILIPTSVGEMPESTPIDFEESKSIIPEKRTIKRSMCDEEQSANTLRHVAAACSVPLNRLRDLEVLIQVRNGDVIGYRDKILFLSNSFMLHAHYSSKKRLNELTRINTLFNSPLPDAELENIWKNSRLAYTPSNKYIIRILDITQAEQTVMKTVMTEQEKDRRRHEKNKCGMSAHDRREFFISEILRGLANGETVVEMAQRLKTTRQTIYNWMKRYSLKASSAVYCAKSSSANSPADKNRIARTTKKAASELLRKIHAESVSRNSDDKEKDPKSKCHRRRLKRKAAEIFLRMLAKSQDATLLESLQKAFFEITGKTLKHSRQIVKNSSTPAFRTLIEAAYWRYLAPQYGKDYGARAFSLLGSE